MPLYSGRIAVNGLNAEGPISLSIPYVGAAGTMRKVKSFSPFMSHTFLTRADHIKNPLLAENTTFQLRVPPTHDDWARPPLNSSTALEPGATPSFWRSLSLGTTELRIEARLMEAAIDETPNQEENILGVKKLGNINGFPWLYQRGYGFSADWSGLLADGTWAPAGRYTFYYYALRVFGDKANLDHWDGGQSIQFHIR